MRIETAMAAIVSSYVAVACGGNAISTGASCGSGTTLVNGQCVLAGASAGQGGDAGGGGVANAGNSGGGAGGAGGGLAGAAGGGLAGGSVDAGSSALVDFCAGRDVVATGAPGLLDDFEDGNIRILENDGRSAVWSLVGEGCTFAPMPLLPQAPPAGATINNASRYALHLTATGCTNPSSLAAAFNGYGDGVHGGACAYDASQYDGMYFWAVGAGVRINVQVGLRTTISEMYGGDGTCDVKVNSCYDRHGLSMPLSADWKQYSFTWSQLHQAGWGTKADWNVKITTEVAFAATSNDASSMSVDYAIDNVGFYKGTPPTDPPAPGQ